MEYWYKSKGLKELNKEEWEALCDGCAKCCLQKLQCEDTNKIYQTSVYCNLLNIKTCQCTDYQNRSKLVADCIKLDYKNTKKLDWLPNTCAYRLISEGKDLPDWHYLISGDKNTVFEAGISIRSYAINGDLVENLEDFITQEII